jgi:hypothetical protein
MVQDMPIADPIRVFVLEEFRLRVADVDGAAARIVAESPGGIEPAIPLLTSIEDKRDVAMLRALHSGESTESDAMQHAALDPLVSSWAVPKHYGPRIAERARSSERWHYRSPRAHALISSDVAARQLCLAPHDGERRAQLVDHRGKEVGCGPVSDNVLADVGEYADRLVGRAFGSGGEVLLR